MNLVDVKLRVHFSLYEIIKSVYKRLKYYPEFLNLFYFYLKLTKAEYTSYTSGSPHSIVLDGSRELKPVFHYKLKFYKHLL